MKTAIVMEINEGSALVMKTGGVFETLPAQAGWQKGDLVSIPEKKRSLKALYAAVACLALLLLSALGGHQLYFTETALVSLDINPSIELSLNRFDRVIDTASFNEDGQAILSAVNLKGLKYQAALTTLLQSEALRAYLERNDYLDISVFGNTELEPEIQQQAQQLTEAYELRVFCHSANAELVAEAHAHGMTPGRYQVFLELQELDPEADIADYAASGVGAMHKEIEAHHQNRYGQQAEHGGQWHGATANSSNVEDVPPPAENIGQRHGQGGGSGNTATTEIATSGNGNGQSGGQAHGMEQTQEPEQVQVGGQGQGHGAGLGEGQKHGQEQVPDPLPEQPEPPAQDQGQGQGSGQAQDQGGSQEQVQGGGQAQDQDISQGLGQGQGQGDGQGQGQGGGQSGGQGGGHGQGHHSKP